MDFRLIGHRGARGEAPENTLAGFAHARALGLTAVEFDLRRTRDDRIVVIHDATVDRTTDGSGAVEDLTLSELRALDARSVHADWPERVTIPTLAEVLDAVPDLKVIQIEIKSEPIARMQRTIDEALLQIQWRGLQAQTMFASFDPDAVAYIQQQAPDQKRSYVGLFSNSEDLETALRLGCVQIDVSLQQGERAVVAEAHARGLRVIGWQCNTTDHVQDTYAWGVDGATSDYPQVVLPELRAVGYALNLAGNPPSTSA